MHGCNSTLDAPMMHVNDALSDKQGCLGKCLLILMHDRALLLGELLSAIANLEEDQVPYIWF